MSTIQIKPELLHVLAALNEKSFTVAELTKHYLDHPNSLHQGKKSARQFVYRNMLRMIKAGLMDKQSDDGGWPKYKLTKGFNAQLATHSAAQKDTASPAKESPDTPSSYSDQFVKPEKMLRERLNKHRSDMLCALGEAEEYETLCQEIPGFSKEAQSLYDEARERSALLLGKIKALECLLSSNSLR